MEFLFRAALNDNVFKYPALMNTCLWLHAIVLKLPFTLTTATILIQRDWKTNIVCKFSPSNKPSFNDFRPSECSFWVNDVWKYLSQDSHLSQDPTVTAKLHCLPINNICPPPTHPPPRHNSKLISQQTTTNSNYTKTSPIHNISYILCTFFSKVIFLFTIWRKVCWGKNRGPQLPQDTQLPLAWQFSKDKEKDLFSHQFILETGLNIHI